MSEGLYNSARTFLDNYNYVLSNSYIFEWESDLFGISSSDYSIEIEIKVSKSDYLADFKKRKHEVFEKSFKAKEGLMKDAFIQSYGLLPNKFYFACPFNLILPDKIPEYAGLLYVDPRFNSFEVVKTAPFIHRSKQDFSRILLNKYYHGSLNTRQRLHSLLNDLNLNNVCNSDVQKKVKSILRLLK